MGLSSSQARLLSITARLTSNEYESQQISNAKMRLANQTQEASEAYIGALNDCEYSFISFDSNGNQVQSPLTVATMYEYADGKNQYILTNSSGKVLLSNKDIENYKNSANLALFLEKYGIHRTFESQKLEDAWDAIYKNVYKDNKTMYSIYGNWNEMLANTNYKEATNITQSKSLWAADKRQAQSDYLKVLGEYTSLINKQREGEDISKTEISTKQSEMEQALQKFTAIVSYNSAIETQIKDSDTDLYNGYQKYQEAMAKYKDELDELGLSANTAYKYDDPSKAQWYTNLWYRLNGSSTDNVGAQNYAYLNAKDGISEFKNGIELDNKIQANDSTLLNSSTWIANALSKGLVNIEQAAYSNEQMTIADNNNPFTFNLHGITWSGKIYSSISDIVQANNDKKIAQAEAEYQRKTAEINAKDEKYQRKLSLLDSEHNAIQTEYESVKNAMNKNIDRSFKAFQG